MTASTQTSYRSNATFATHLANTNTAQTPIRSFLNIVLKALSAFAA